MPTDQDEQPLLSAEPILNSETEIIDHVKYSSCNKLIMYFMAIHFLLAFSEIVLVTPLIKLFEESLCLSHYNFPNSGVDETMCKIPQIQRPLATIRGWKSTLDTIPVFVVTIPAGKFGDYYGRKIIMTLSLAGIAGSMAEIFVVCAFPRTFPLRLVWLSSIALLCGGGLNAASSFMWAMAADSFPSARRSHAFYYIFSAFYVAELLSSSVATLTVDISPWIPCGLALGSVILCVLLVSLLPYKSKLALDGIPAGIPAARTQIPDSYSKSTDTTMINGFVSAISNNNVMLVIPVFLVGILRYTTLNVLIQYSGERFGMKISTGAMFYTETAIVNMVLFLILIPSVIAYLRRKYQVRPMVVDLWLVKASVLLMCVGSLGIGIAPSSGFLPLGVLIFAAGFGSRVFTLSLVSNWIADDMRATLYASITVLESLGHAIGDPCMQQLFAASLELPPFWHAIPFFVAAGLYGSAFVSTSFLHIEEEKEMYASNQ